MNLGEIVPVLLASAGIIILVPYILMYLSRYIYSHKLKSEDYRYLDRHILGTIERILDSALIIAAFVIIVFLLSFSFESIEENVWSVLKAHMTGIVGIPLAIYLTFLSAAFTQKYILLSKEEHAVDKTESVKPHLLDLADLWLKWAIYAIGGIFILAIILNLFPPIHKYFQEELPSFLENALSEIVFIVILISIVYTFNRAIKSFFSEYKNIQKKFNPKVLTMIGTGIEYGLYALLGVIIIFGTLSVFGFPNMALMVIGMILTLLVITTLIVVFTPLNNSLSGIGLMNSDPIDEGDWICIPEKEISGKVLKMNMTYTVIEGSNGEIMSIPNNTLLSNGIVNYTRSENLMAEIVFSVSAETPVDKIKECAEKAMSGKGDFELAPDKIADGKAVYRLIFKVNDYKDTGLKKLEILNTLQVELGKEEISFV